MQQIEKFDILESRILIHTETCLYQYFLSDLKIFLEQFFDNKKLTVIEMIQEHNDIYGALSNFLNWLNPHKAFGKSKILAVSVNRKVESLSGDFQGMSYSIEFENGLKGNFLSTKFNLLCGKFWIDGYPCPLQIGDELEFRYESIFNHKYKRTFNNFKLNVSKIMKAYRLKEKEFKMSLVAA
jgi:hypothetical protein